MHSLPFSTGEMGLDYRPRNDMQEELPDRAYALCIEDSRSISGIPGLGGGELFWVGVGFKEGREAFICKVVCVYVIFIRTTGKEERIHFCCSPNLHWAADFERWKRKEAFNTMCSLTFKHMLNFPIAISVT